ncbi:baseplate J/gp47 family protein [Chitinophaga japonensis]|uniref:Baseplate J-like protein n=1 Tax=Chitinophaga japonensis TaxID=104662 RepID=A0A562STE9_CHIJA|nr:hypothetical protein [Chitinophaga japonensis]TWI84525.1 hypothetical protein LX66_4895 [Chitinophaga japonensis]
MSNFFEHIQDGISQLERQLEALMPAYVKVDDRSPHELLQLLARLAPQFNYYNFNNRPDGGWEEFFHADLLVMLLTAGSLDFTGYEATFTRLRENLQHATSDDALFDNTRTLFLLLYDIGVVLMDTLHKLREADKSYRIWHYVEQVMDSLEEDMTRLHRFEHQVVKLFPRQLALHDHHIRPLDLSHRLRRLYTRAFNDAGDGPELFEGFYSLNGIYDNLRAKFYQVASSASYYIRNQLGEVQHSPHMGLLAAFLELYKHLQDQLNKVPKRHLDFYYRQVLGIQGLPAVPDKVHIFLELVPHINSFTVEKGQALLAAVHARKEPLQYILRDTLKAHNVQIMSLQTVFVSNYLQITAPSLDLQDIREAQVYRAVHPVIPPADYQKESTVIRPWPLLGEDQHDLSPSLRTMEDTDIGFMIGSPVMYLDEGRRQVQVRLYFEPGTFGAFAGYVKNFAQVSGHSVATMLSQLLSGAFHLYFTAPDGWEPVPRFSVRSSLEEPLDNSLEITFMLDITAKAWSTYNEKVHASGLAAAVPLLKVLLNNNSFHHPYSFLRSLLLERVAVNVQVSGHRHVKLQSNIGMLSPDNSFLLFGPQPAVGAYLDIRNSNIFNRFTRAFSIKMEWLNLPRHENGFDAWYAGYNTDLRNTDFKIGISSLYNGLFFPEREKQQTLHLFQTVRDREGNLYLDDVTLLDNIDLSRLSFTNGMLLDKEWAPDVPVYREGAVRMELAGPSEAFGHRLFAQIFPEVIMHNSQHSLLPRKKRPVPNLPYLPMLNALSLSYTLEHMEALKSVQSAQQADGLEVYHALPSGYRRIYPDPGKGNTFSLLPVTSDMANLCIGFNRLYPNEELSLLFQLEEKHYSDTVGNITPVTWSYLYNNSWIPFERTQVLSDDTSNLLKSGIVRLRIPDGICNGNTILDPALYWLRVSTSVVTGANPRVIGIFPNAVLAERQLQAEGQSLKEVPSIASFAIKKFKTDIKPVQQVWQPFPSFGGQQQEPEAQYYTRVSERLRHKQRPALASDIAQVLLQEFPGLLIVKCLGTDEGAALLPGMADLRIIVVPAVPDMQPGRQEVPEPRVDLATLYRIQSFVQQALSPFIKAEVRNPVYEKVKVVCKVKFNGSDNRNDNLHLRQLHEDIKRFLCPWMFEGIASLKIGSVLYRSEILNFINRLSYVSYVTGFSLVHFYHEKHLRTGQVTACVSDTALDDAPAIYASVPEGVLVPTQEHLITVLDHRAYEDPQALGIDGLQVGDELLVGKDLETGTARHMADPFDEEMLTISIHPK